MPNKAAASVHSFEASSAAVHPLGAVEAEWTPSCARVSFDLDMLANCVCDVLFHLPIREESSIRLPGSPQHYAQLPMPPTAVMPLDLTVNTNQNAPSSALASISGRCIHSHQHSLTSALAAISTRSHQHSQPSALAAISTHGHQRHYAQCTPASCADIESI